jgi:tetratricopeptide (TPR) repeat protein
MRARWFLAATATAIAALLPASTSANVGNNEHAHGNLGRVEFPISCTAEAQQLFNHATALLHSFFYPETIKAFTKVTEADPSCAMSYWGLAMSQRPNPLIGPMPATVPQKGREAVAKAKAAGPRTKRESGYVAAMDAYYAVPDDRPHAERAQAYADAMEKVHRDNPDDDEAAIFYALALNEAVDLADKTYANQRKAGTLLLDLMDRYPEHPGIAHYVIHTYDFAPIAEQGLEAARRYAAIAPGSPHALHMPSHTFSMLGHWKESIDANLASMEASRAYSAAAFDGVPEVVLAHDIDFAVYAYLQQAQDEKAREMVEEAGRIAKFALDRLPGYTALAAIPARYAIERGTWEDVARLQPRGSSFPAAEAITHFTRALGAARTGDRTGAKADIAKLQDFHQALLDAKQGYWAEQVKVQIDAAEAWSVLADGETERALTLMRAAADLEDSTEKHIAMENRLVPMRELLAEMLLETGHPQDALREFAASLQSAPERFRSIWGAARAAEAVGDNARAKDYYDRLIRLTASADTERPEMIHAKAFLARNG